MRGPRRPRTEVAPCKAGSRKSGRRLRRQKGWGVLLVRELRPPVRGGCQAYVPGAFSRTVQTGARSPLLTSAGWPASRPPSQAVLGALGQKEGSRGGRRSPEVGAPVRTRGWELAATLQTDLESIRGGQLSEHQRLQPAHPAGAGGGASPHEPRGTLLSSDVQPVTFGVCEPWSRDFRRDARRLRWSRGGRHST